MSRGRKTLPTEIKKTKGTLRKSRELENQVIAKMVVDYPAAPKIFNEYAKSVWNKTIPELRTMGVLASIDMELISAYCIEMGRYNEANEIIKQNKSPLTKAPSGYPMIHPWYTVARQSLKAALEIGCNFGITAASRTKISVNKKVKLSPSELARQKAQGE